MKKALFILFPASVIFLFSFDVPQKLPTGNTLYSRPPAYSAAKEWIDDFKLLRDAVYKNDKAKVKGFFTFPVLNPANEIWFLVLTEKEREAKKLADTITPFEERDFDKYYKKLFPAAFINTLLTIKSAELFNKGEAESAERKQDNATTRMYASVDKENSVLVLNLSYSYVWKDENGEVTDGGESTVIYSFKILRNGHLQFMHIRLAG